MSDKKINELVVDTNVIIQGTPLQDLATIFYSVPEVFAEVRSQRTRDQLASLPFEIIYEAPSEESLKAGKSIDGSKAVSYAYSVLK